VHTGTITLLFSRVRNKASPPTSFRKAYFEKSKTYPCDPSLTAWDTPSPPLKLFCMAPSPSYDEQGSTTVELVLKHFRSTSMVNCWNISLAPLYDSPKASSHDYDSPVQYSQISPIASRRSPESMVEMVQSRSDWVICKMSLGSKLQQSIP
jgi:hypothetical protein